MKLIAALGLDVRILIAQLINFSILIFVLYKFAYKPILEFLDKRSKEIEKGVADAEEAKNKLKEMEEKEKDILKKARQEALAILDEAKEDGKGKGDELIEKAKKEIGQIIDGEKEKMRQEKAETLKEVKKEVVDIVVVALEKVLEEKVDAKKDKEIIKNIVKGIK